MSLDFPDRVTAGTTKPIKVIMIAFKPIWCSSGRSTFLACLVFVGLVVFFCFFVCVVVLFVLCCCFVHLFFYIQSVFSPTFVSCFFVGFCLFFVPVVFRLFVYVLFVFGVVFWFGSSGVMAFLFVFVSCVFCLFCVRWVGLCLF